jgi:hypothetical protein
MTSCAHSALAPSTVTLIVPDAFHGEVFVIEDAEKGQDWRKSDVVVSSSGVAFVKDLPSLAAIAPAKFRARFANGKKMGNSVLQTGEEISLWPVSYIDNRLLYFVVGTWDEKTDRENERMHGDWKQVYAKIKGKK